MTKRDPLALFLIVCLIAFSAYQHHRLNQVYEGYLNLKVYVFQQDAELIEIFRKNGIEMN